MLAIHPNARTTPAVRAEIARSAEPTGELARRYGVSTETVRKWRKRGPAQHLADRALAQPDREAGLDQGLQVDAPPAHHAVPVRVRPLLHGGHQLGLLPGREARLAPRPGPVAEAGEAFGVVAVHPVAQGLPVHAGRPRRLLARGPLQHQRQGEHPPRRPRVPAPRRLAPQLAGARLVPGDRDRHPRPPVSASNHRSTAAGATRLRARQHVRNSGRWYNTNPPPARPGPPWTRAGSGEP